jgi:hypothetical protein
LVYESVLSDKTLPGPGVVGRTELEYANSAFDIATVELLDAGQAALGDDRLLEIADLLELAG